MRSRAQSSIEYLLLLAAFFGVLGVMLPVMSQTTQGFLSAGDELLAKRISSDLTEQVSLMKFLGEGSTKQFEYFPSKSITVSSRGNEVLFSAGENEFPVDLGEIQVFPKQELTGKFFLIIQKKLGRVQINILEESSQHR
ncbi:MAG: hypothetical protein WCW44_03220 [archaeon]|jgi:hypothetical protein